MPVPIRRMVQTDTQTERKILTAAIVSDEFLRQAQPLLRPEWFSSPVTQKVAEWVTEYFSNHSHAPKGNIEDMFHARARELSEEDAADCRLLLMSISSEYENDGNINVSYLLDRATKYFRETGLKNRVAEVRRLLDAGRIDEAEALFSETLPACQSADDGVMSLQQLLESPEIERRDIVDGLLPEDAVSLLVGAPKSGKSTFARQLSLALVKKASFLNRETKKTRVLYCAFREDSLAEIKQHYKEMIVLNDTEAANNLLIFDKKVDGNPFSWLRSMVQKHEPGFVVLDTLMKFSKGLKDTNDYAAVVRAMEGITDIARDEGCHIMCLHHRVKADRGRNDGTEVLGSAGLFGCADMLISMNRSERGTTFYASGRGINIEPTVLNFNEQRKTFEIGMSVQAENATRLQDEILNVLNESGTLTEDEIVQGVEGSTRSIRAALRSLGARIVKDGTGRRGNPFIYRLPGSNGSGGRPILNRVREPERVVRLEN